MTYFYSLLEIYSLMYLLLHSILKNLYRRSYFIHIYVGAYLYHKDRPNDYTMKQRMYSAFAVDEPTIEFKTPTATDSVCGHDLLVLTPAMHSA